MPLSKDMRAVLAAQEAWGIAIDRASDAEKEVIHKALDAYWKTTQEIEDEEIRLRTLHQERGSSPYDREILESLGALQRLKVEVLRKVLSRYPKLSKWVQQYDDLVQVFRAIGLDEA